MALINVKGHQLLAALVGLYFAEIVFRKKFFIDGHTTTIKYFAHFNVSNYIIGSPVGIKAIVGG